MPLPKRNLQLKFDHILDVLDKDPLQSIYHQHKALKQTQQKRHEICVPEMYLKLCAQQTPINNLNIMAQYQHQFKGTKSNV